MRKLLLLTRLNLINSLIERTDMLLYTLSNCIGPIVILFVWLSFTPSGTISVYSHDQLIRYFLWVMLIKILTSAWGGYFLSNRIKRGAISPLLTQPTPYIFHWISNNIAEKIIKLVILVPVILILIAFFRLSFSPVSLINLTAFLVSTLMAIAITFLVDIIFGLLAFWLDETSAFIDVYGLFNSLFSGVLIPLVALPLFVRDLGAFLPFRYLLSFPIEVILDQLSTLQILQGLLIQTGWLVVTLYVYKSLWSAGLKVYSSSGA